MSKDKELLFLIERMIQLEVKRQVDAAISNLRKSVPKQKKAPSLSELLEAESPRHPSKIERPVVKNKAQIQTGNPIVDKILAETQGGLPQDPTGPLVLEESQVQSVVDIAKMSDAPDELKNIFTKDYRTLLKAVDKKVKKTQ